MIEFVISLFDKLSVTSQAAIIASIVTLVGSVIAATIALIGVFITHRGNERRFKLQLDYDRNQNRIDREMELRREIFLDSTEAIDAGLTGLFGLLDLAKSHEELFKKHSDKHTSISKVHLIARESTVGLVMAFDNEFGKEILRLSLLRTRLTQIQTQIKIQEDRIQASGKERDRIIELMKQLNYEGIVPPHHRWDFVNNTFKYEGQAAEKALEEKSTLELRLKTEWVNFATECFSAGNKLRGLLPQVVKAVRDELDLPFNYAKYLATFEENQKQQQSLQSDFLIALRNG